MNNEQTREKVKEIMLEILLTGEVEMFGLGDNLDKLRTYKQLIDYDFVKVSKGELCITQKGREWLDEQRS